MASRLIPELLKQTREVLSALTGHPVQPGQPYAREVPQTQYQYNVAVHLGPPDARLIVFVLSLPAETLDSLVGLSEGNDEARIEALVGAAVRVCEAAAAGCPGTQQVELPRAVIGYDIILPELRTLGRRLCVPWHFYGGAFVCEIGTAA